MVRDSSAPKMEPLFYDELQVPDLTSIKRKLTLDLTSRGAKRPRLADNQPAILSSPDLVMLKLGTPEIERMIMDQPCGMVTPNTTQLLFSSQNTPDVQGNYASGFMDDLDEFQNSDSSQDGTQHEMSRGTYTSIDSHYPDFNYGMSPSSSVTIKDEPQTVPNLNSPVSPINMENQEKIKLERKRQRNRVAASKCRRRKLERIATLEDRVKLLKSENADLALVVNRLKQQVYNLKQQVMVHAKSGCHISVASTGM